MVSVYVYTAVGIVLLVAFVRVGLKAGTKERLNWAPVSNPHPRFAFIQHHRYSIIVLFLLFAMTFVLVKGLGAYFDAHPPKSLVSDSHPAQ